MHLEIFVDFIQETNILDKNLDTIMMGGKVSYHGIKIHNITFSFACKY